MFCFSSFFPYLLALNNKLNLSPKYKNINSCFKPSSMTCLKMHLWHSLSIWSIRWTSIWRTFDARVIIYFLLLLTKVPPGSFNDSKWKERMKAKIARMGFQRAHLKCFKASSPHWKEIKEFNLVIVGFQIHLMFCIKMPFHDFEVVYL